MGFRPSGATAAKPVVSRISFFGDSWAEGVPGASRKSLSFPSRVARAVGAREDNFAVGGARNHQTTDTILARALQQTKTPSQAPYQAGHQVAIVQTSINNLNLNATIADLSIVTRSVLRALRHIRAAGTYEALDATRWAFTGSWSTVLDTTNSGTGIKRAGSNGDSWIMTTPADFPGGILRLYGYKATGFGGLHTITVDGVAHGTIDNRTATATNGSEPWEYPVTLTAGTHTIAGTVSPLNGAESVNGADFEAADPPLVIVLNTARTRNYPGGEHTIVDADVDASNAALAAMLTAQFPGDARVQLLNIDTLLGKNDAYLSTDGIHPNDAGNAIIAAAISNLILTGSAAAINMLSAAQIASGDAPLARRVREPTQDSRSGIATLVAGTTVVASRIVTATSRIALNVQSVGTVTRPQAMGVSSRTAGTSFTIKSLDATDTSSVWWEIVEPDV